MSSPISGALAQPFPLLEVRRKVLEVYPLAAKRDYDDATLARLAGVSTADLERLGEDPECVQALADELRAAENDGRLLKSTAMLLMGKALDRIGEQIDTMDAFEVPEVMRPIQKYLDAADRREALLKDKYADLPMVTIIIGSNMTVTTTTQAADVDSVSATESVDAGVIDVEAKRLDVAKPSPSDLKTAAGLDAFALLSSATPLADETGDESWV